MCSKRIFRLTPMQSHKEAVSHLPSLSIIQNIIMYYISRLSKYETSQFFRYKTLRFLPHSELPGCKNSRRERQRSLEGNECHVWRNIWKGFGGKTKYIMFCSSRSFSRESPWKDKIYYVLFFQSYFPENHLGRTKYIIYCFSKSFKTIFQRITLEGRKEGGRERPEGEVRDVGLKINIIWFELFFYSI